MKRILNQFKKLPTDSGELEKLARDLGVSMSNTFLNKHGQTGMDSYEVQRRIREARREWRDGLVWLFAFLSAAASVISALAAWAARGY